MVSGEEPLAVVVELGRPSVVFVVEEAAVTDWESYNTPIGTKSMASSP